VGENQVKTPGVSRDLTRRRGQGRPVHPKVLRGLGGNGEKKNQETFGRSAKNKNHRGRKKGGGGKGEGGHGSLGSPTQKVQNVSTSKGGLNNDSSIGHHHRGRTQRQQPTKSLPQHDAQSETGSEKGPPCMNKNWRGKVGNIHTPREKKEKVY